MPQLVRVVRDGHAPREADGVELALVDAFEHDGPFEGEDFELDSGAREVLLQDREELLVGRAGVRIDHGEDERLAVLVQHAVAVGVLPSGVREHLLRLLDVEFIRCDRGVVGTGIHEERTGDRAHKVGIDVPDDARAVDQMAERHANVPVLEERILLIQADVRIGHARQAHLPQEAAFPELRRVGVVHPLLGREAVGV